MRQQLKHFGIKGTFLVLKNGQVFDKFANANNVDTSYMINSVQKFMTAGMILRGVELHKITLNDKLSKFYPEVAGSNKVTIRDLLNMTSGLSLKGGFKLNHHPYISDHHTLELAQSNTVYNSFMHGKWQYSSLNYLYLSGITAKIYRMSFEEAFNKLYIEPLHLNHTSFVWDAIKNTNSHLVQGYVNGRLYNNPKLLNDAHADLVAGSIVSSNADVVKILRYIFSDSFVNNIFWQDYFKGQSSITKYYAGLYDKGSFYSANGAGSGYYTLLRASKDFKTLILFQTNQTQTGKFALSKAHINQIMKVLMSI